MLDMPGRSFTGPLPLLSSDEIALGRELRTHVEVLANDIGERHVRRPDALRAAAAYIERSLASVGCAVRSESFIADGVDVRNLELEIPGSDLRDEVIIVGAHYDSVDECPAANDNASGIAGTISLAHRLFDSKPRRTLRFVAFVNEEPPFFHTDLMGSLVYARACKARGEKIVGMISLETIGCFFDEPGTQKYPAPFGALYPDVGNFIAFVGDSSARQFMHESLALWRQQVPFPSEGAAMPDIIPGIGWSDHWSFSQVGYPAFMVTDTAPFRYTHYHTPQDTPDKLDFDRMARVVAGVELLVRRLSGIAGR